MGDNTTPTDKQLVQFYGTDAICWDAALRRAITNPHIPSLSRRQTSLEYARIKHWIGEFSNPVAHPDGLVAVAEIDDVDPWIVRHANWLKWLECDSSRLLWVSGPPGKNTPYLIHFLELLCDIMDSRNSIERNEWLTAEHPGCGKSSLASRAVKSTAESQHSKAVVVSHAFQSEVSTLHRSPVSLAASILDQLLLSTRFISQSQQKILDKLAHLYNQYGSRPGDCPFERMWALCIPLLKSESDFILIIDGLDECAFNHAGQVSSLLDQISALLSSTIGRAAIFTRPNPMFGVGTFSQPLDCEIRITVEDTLSELNAFCNSASAKLWLLPRPLQLEVAERARANAHGSFLWATLFFEKLNNIFDIRTFTRAMDEFPDNCWDFHVRAWCHRVSELGANEKALCQNIMLIILGARRRLTLGEIEDATGLFPTSTQFIISSFCQPLVQVIDDGLQLSHGSVRDFLPDGEFTQSQQDSVLARRCLDFLLKDDYAREDRIGQYLKRNGGIDGSTQGHEKNFYDYAARNWHIHLTALPFPDPTLLVLADRFLRAFQFVTWAEYSYTDTRNFQAIRSTEIALTAWFKSLPENHRSLLHLNDYFERPYSDLSKTYKEKSDDNALQLLALMHLGFYYFGQGRMPEAARVLTEACTGLCELLGQLHPLSVRARWDAESTFLFDGRLRKDGEVYDGLAEDQHKAAEDECPRRLPKSVRRAQSEYLSSDSEAEPCGMLL
ncbi:hypothetical protein FDECE_1455 [Fusarium decemcellulare]|nr:hypothetical protein FDECE_1455 [Fusarium decemcellulare]